MKSPEQKKAITIYHLHFFATKEDYYFGSISAIYECFDKTLIGIAASSLYNLNLDEATNPVYENTKCRIKKSHLHTKAKKNGKM
ncbi:hypothetical protein M2480_001796 [Parabacteroides sp. PFB2-12]|uniref:hypothetical protein n=1 Tax=unclassified Parabacteroides TaxID=2649774 RepID=UPI0024730BAE|nr:MULTISPECIES: hypothetical protein [unclassified Parabacteroides]MDH6343170.1 hypothetical protein [Parabacteroides sp. PM6-13]MDH6390814.1 hypothetical protein [Parabacteroides sp. PFB2-12]